MKKLYAFVFFVVSSLTLKAQFQFDLGLGLATSSTITQNFMRPITYLTGGGVDTQYYAYKLSASGYGLNVFPKYHIKEIAHHTLSVGAPMIFGFSGSSNPQQGSSLSFLYDLNLCVDINGGRLSKKRDHTDKTIGYFLGFGLGVTNTSGLNFDGGISKKVDKNTPGVILVPENEYIDNYFSAKATGFLIHAGITAPFKFDKNDENNMGLRFFVKPSLGKNQLTYFGASLFISVGKNGEL